MTERPDPIASGAVPAAPSRRSVLVGASIGITTAALPPAAAAASEVTFSLSAAATFTIPYGVTVDGSGTVYVADTFNNAVRRITPAGVVTTIVGAGGSSPLSIPTAIAVGGATLHVSDQGNARLVSVPVTGGTPVRVGTSSIGTRGVAVSTSGDVFAFRNLGDGTNEILRIAPGGAESSVVTGLGSAPKGLTWVEEAGEGVLYVGDGALVRRVVVATGATTTVNTSGATLSDVSGVVRAPGGVLYVADLTLNSIYTVSTGGAVSLLAGPGTSGTTGSTDAAGSSARFTSPYGLAIHPTRVELYVADGGNHRIRRVTSAGVVSTFAGTGGTGLNDD